MKKYTIVIIGLVVTALVLGSCDVKFGGTFEITNGYSAPMLIAVGIAIPSLDGVEAVEAGKTKRFSFKDDGLYTIAYLPVSTSGGGIQSKMEYLSGGETKKITIKP